MHLPVFAERQVSEDALRQALAIVREEGKDMLKDRDTLVSQLDHPVFDGEDDINLERASCPTANGEHGDAWGLAFQVARELSHTPREILTRGAALFGDEPPTADDGPYSPAWRRVTDGEQAFDLLIGGYGHAHIGGAGTRRRPRVVAIDEFPDRDPFEQSFGEQYLDHATWTARCLYDDVDDRQAFHEADLWGDEWVRAWLKGDGEQGLSQADAESLVIRSTRKPAPTCVPCSAQCPIGRVGRRSRHSPPSGFGSGLSHPRSRMIPLAGHSTAYTFLDSGPTPNSTMTAVEVRPPIRYSSDEAAAAAPSTSGGRRHTPHPCRRR